MTSDNGPYCCVYEVMTCCRFYALGQQQACPGFEMARWARRCMWWTRMDDNRYHCGNAGAQRWAADEYNKNLKEKEESGDGGRNGE